MILKQLEEVRVGSGDFAGREGDGIGWVAEWTAAEGFRGARNVGFVHEGRGNDACGSQNNT